MRCVNRLVRREVNARINPELLKLKLRHLEGLVREMLSEVEALSGAPGGGTTIGPDHGISLREEVRRFECGLIKQALWATGGHQTRAAALLGVKLTTLNTKIKLYRLSAKVPACAHEGGSALLAVGRRSG